eukprot:892379-Prorocentrum_minimum.AAC.1
MACELSASRQPPSSSAAFMTLRRSEAPTDALPDVWTQAHTFAVTTSVDRLPWLSFIAHLPQQSTSTRPLIVSIRVANPRM